MYLDFIYIILGYHSSLTKKEKKFDLYVPFFISIASLIYTLLHDYNIQYSFIREVVIFVGSLLGFTLAALTLLLSNGRIEEKTRLCNTNRKIRGKNITMYELIVVFYSYLIIVEMILCILYYIANLFSTIDLGILGYVFNTIYIFGTFHVFFTTIRTVATLYFIATGLR